METNCLSRFFTRGVLALSFIALFSACVTKREGAEDLLNVKIGDDFEALVTKVPSIISKELIGSPLGIAAWRPKGMDGLVVLSFCDPEHIPGKDSLMAENPPSTTIQAIFRYYGRGDKRNAIIKAKEPALWDGYWYIIDCVYAEEAAKPMEARR